MVIFTEDNIFPELRKLQSSDPRERYCATMERDLREEVRLTNRPGGFGFRIRNSYYENLSDFDTYLRGMPSPLLTQSASPFHEVEILKANGYWLDEAATSTIEAVSSSN
jgi:hypothetical protein